MELFTKEQLDENERKKEQLLNLIATGEAFLMAGSGVSKIQGYPLWKEFITHLEVKVRQLDELFEFRGENEENDIVYSTRLVNVLGSRFYDEIDDVFGEDRGYHPCHVSLISLPFKSILTTNYDRLLERAIRNKYPSAENIEILIDSSFSKRELYKFLRSINTGKSRAQKVFHLHGECRHTDSIVFSSNHYETKYGILINRSTENSTAQNIIDETWTLHRKIIWSLMATRRIVYMGFSMDDEYFRIMHHIVSEDVRFFDTDTHFLITRITDNENINEVLKKAEKFKIEFGIETIFFIDDSQNKGLVNFIFELEKQINVPRTHKRVKQSKIMNNGDQEITDKLFETGLKQFYDENK